MCSCSEIDRVASEPAVLALERIFLRRTMISYDEVSLEGSFDLI